MSADRHKVVHGVQEAVHLIGFGILLTSVGVGCIDTATADVRARRTDAGIADAATAGSSNVTSPLDALEIACKKGDAQACRSLAETLQLGSDGHRDEKRAAVLWEKALMLGDLNSCHWGGLMYEQGGRTPGGLPSDYSKAFSLYKYGCDRDAAECCLDLANLFRTGRGVRKDRKRMSAFIRRAEKLGYVPD
jgi:TPR repeat protein